MKLNHINLVTLDGVALADFFTNHFGFELVAMRGKNAFAVLSGADGFALNIMKPGKGETVSYPDGFHIGFFVDMPNIVHEKHAELADAGHAPGEVQELTRGGAMSTTFYCHAPGGILVEVSSSAA
ncbi:VOC family protein [Mesorhizobium sp. PAMC28654]|uniref:VOC family protein n=1 Tax=Mesorhizobium sp. PAMC28654 TaxID=2880934 RepID=UPI001D0B5F67|nr:VOC family protein [Mesorhizobium sp. PAMC28654]UDL92642.1 VOC family protein [Mesorhizobium sp. PAMC28654]